MAKKSKTFTLINLLNQSVYIQDVDDNTVIIKPDANPVKITYDYHNKYHETIQSDQIAMKMYSENPSYIFHNLPEFNPNIKYIVPYDVLEHSPSNRTDLVTIKEQGFTKVNGEVILITPNEFIGKSPTIKNICTPNNNNPPNRIHQVKGSNRTKSYTDADFPSTLFDNNK